MKVLIVIAALLVTSCTMDAGETFYTKAGCEEVVIDDFYANKYIATNQLGQRGGYYKAELVKDKKDCWPIVTTVAPPDIIEGWNK